VHRVVADLTDPVLFQWPDTNELGSRLYTDTRSAGGRLTAGGAWTFTLGINNLFNEKPRSAFPVT
jgi:outer membrane receptor protein involved in Fe transport